MSEENGHNEVNFDELLTALNRLKVSEIEELEERTGLSIEVIGDSDKPKGKMLRALAYIIRKRNDPEFTWEAAGDLVVRLDVSEAEPTTVPPTDAAG